MHHDMPSSPGAIIGYRKNGAPIRLQAGGAGDDGGTGAEGSSDATGGDTGNPTDPPAGDSGSGSDPAGSDADGTTGDSSTGSGTPPADDRAARTIAAVREDFKAERAKRQALERDLAAIRAAQEQAAQQTQERNLALAKALGLPGTEDPPDPAKLAADLEAERQARQAELSHAQARERELRVENGLLKQAGKHGADPSALLDSRSFVAKLTALDPGSESFDDDLGDVIKAAVEANPGFKTAPAKPAKTSTTGQGSGSSTTAPPARSGGEHNGAPGGNRQWTDDDVTRATPQELSKAIEDGLLANLGINAPKRRRS